MTTVTRDDYNHLKNNILLNRRYYSANEQHMAVLKHRYENEVNSPRRFSQINTLSQLLDILEKRDCVSENNITILEEIAKDTSNYQFLAEINNLRRYEPSPTAVNEIQIGPIDVKQRVENVIATKIGGKWIDFARELKVCESKIDILKINTKNNPEKCAREVMAFHEQNVHKREWRSKLLEALEKARRNDLKIEVMKIFDDFSE